MNIWQTILKAITFGAYDPEKKFEQEVLGEATINLEEIESLREGVKKAVGQFDELYPTNNFWNNYDLGISNQCIGQSTCFNVIQKENELQEQGKYVGMDEETRIKAILGESWAAQSKKTLELESSHSGQTLVSGVAEAYGISQYQKYMAGEGYKVRF